MSHDSPSGEELKVRLASDEAERRDPGALGGAVALQQPTASALDSISEGFVILDRDWCCVFANSAAERFLQKSRAELIGQSLWEVFPEASTRRFGLEYRRAVAENVPVHFEEFYPEPLNTWYEVRAYPTAEGLSIVFHDVTERRRVEEALRVNLTKYSVLFDSFPLGISVTDSRGNLREANRATVRLLGLSEEEHARRRIDGTEWQIIRPDGSPMSPDEFASVRALKEQRLIQDVEMGLVRPGDDVTWINVSAVPLPLEGYGVVITYGDISPRKRAEKAIEEAHREAVAARARLATSEAALQRANEELRAANEALRRSNETLEARVAARTADLAQRTAQLQALARDLTRAEERERQRVAQVIHDHLQQLLSVARINLGMALGRVRTRSIQKSLSEVDGLIAESLDITRSLTAELSPAILHRSGLTTALRWLGRWYEDRFALGVVVEAEEDLDVEEEIRVTLFRSVRELLFNVVKHARATSARVRLSRAADGRVRIAVSDEGVGFDPETLRAREGTDGSFGLLSLRERLALLGGQLEVDSAPGRGASFTILAPLPQRVGPEPSAPAAALAAPPAVAVRRHTGVRRTPARRKKR